MRFLSRAVTARSTRCRAMRVRVAPLACTSDGGSSSRTAASATSSAGAPATIAASAAADRTGVGRNAEQGEPGAPLAHRAHDTREREVAVAASQLFDREPTRPRPHREPRRDQQLRRTRPSSSTFRRRSRRRRRAATPPPTRASSISAPSATATAGYSDAGSACASEPPTVPRLRIWKCPMSGVARASNGAAAATVGSCSMTRCRVPARTTSVPFSRVTPVSASTRFTSTRCSKRVNRSASIGTRLCPPASTLASSPCSASSPHTSSIVSGAWYENGAGFTNRPKLAAN